MDNQDIHTRLVLFMGHMITYFGIVIYMQIMSQTAQQQTKTSQDMSIYLTFYDAITDSRRGVSTGQTQRRVF